MNPPTKENVMITLNRDPIYVMVLPDRWDSFGPKTFRSRLLHNVLKKIGGISETVSPGWYDFNVVRQGLKFVTSLTPHVE
jgi:hypothetical protein